MQYIIGVCESYSKRNWIWLLVINLQPWKGVKGPQNWCNILTLSFCIKRIFRKKLFSHKSNSSNLEFTFYLWRNWESNTNSYHVKLSQQSAKAVLKKDVLLLMWCLGGFLCTLNKENLFTQSYANDMVFRISRKFLATPSDFIQKAFKSDGWWAYFRDRRLPTRLGNHASWQKLI